MVIRERALSWILLPKRLTDPHSERKGSKKWVKSAFGSYLPSKAKSGFDPFLF
jgi:hypothetical protein